MRKRLGESLSVKIQNILYYPVRDATCTNLYLAGMLWMICTRLHNRTISSLIELVNKQRE